MIFLNSEWKLNLTVQIWKGKGNPYNCRKDYPKCFWDEWDLDSYEASSGAKNKEAGKSSNDQMMWDQEYVRSNKEGSWQPEKDLTSTKSQEDYHTT